MKINSFIPSLFNFKNRFATLLDEWIVDLNPVKANKKELNMIRCGGMLFFFCEFGKIPSTARVKCLSFDQTMHVLQMNTQIID